MPAPRRGTRRPAHFHEAGRLLRFGVWRQQSPSTYLHDWRRCPPRRGYDCSRCCLTIKPLPPNRRGLRKTGTQLLPATRPRPTRVSHKEIYCWTGLQARMWKSLMSLSGPELDELKFALADELRLQGLKPYVVASPRSTALAAVAFAWCIAEIHQQQERLGIDADRIYTSSVGRHASWIGAWHPGTRHETEAGSVARRFNGKVNLNG